MNKKIIYALMMLLMLSFVSAAYTVNERYTGNIDFNVNTYRCTTSACTAVTNKQVFGTSDDVTITYSGSGTQSNQDYYVLFAYDPEGCYATKSGSANWWGDGTHNFGPYSITFSKTPAEHCGTNIEITTTDNQEVDVGETVTVNANVQAAWNLKNPPYFVPDDLLDIYTSYVDLNFTVFNEDYTEIVYEEHDFIEIPHNTWYYPEYYFIPTEPGTYHLRVWSKMDNDCKCEGSNLKWDEITIYVPNFCGDGELQQPNDDGEFETCDWAATSGPGYHPECRDDSFGDDHCTYCGDEIFQESLEECDYSITDPSDPGYNEDCTQECTIAPTYCGDGELQQPNDDGEFETCDWAATSGPGYHPECRDDSFGDDHCTYCGDEIFQESLEECDYSITDPSDPGYNEDCTQECRIPRECILELTKTDNPDPVSPGDDLFYTIVLENVGTADCTGGGVQMWEFYDDDTTFVSANPTPDNGIDYWNFGVVEPGERHEINIQMRVNDDAECDEYLLNEVKVWSLELGDMWVDEETLVICEEEPYCELTFTKDNDKDPVDRGEIFTYILDIENIGTGDCTGGGVDLTEFYDDNTTFVSANPVPTSGDDYWNFGVISPGESVRVEIDVRVNDDALCDSQLVNRARLWSAENGEQWEEEETYVLCSYVEECGNDVVDPGEQCDDGNLENGDGCSSTCEFESTDPMTVIVHKIVCDREEDLPNWSPARPPITASTAQDFIDSHPDCRFEQDWYFQWALDSEAEFPDDNVGELGDGWHTFGPTNSNGMTSVEIDDLKDDWDVKFREVFQPGYVPFTGTELDTGASAEFYCHDDVYYYDNYDYVFDAVLGETYYCVGFNVEQYCGNGVVENSEECEYNSVLGQHQECSATCEIVDLEYCGDGIVNNDEECDGTAGVGDHQSCTAQCTLTDVTYCGDGVWQNPNGEDVAEECDGTDNVPDHYTCSNECVLVYQEYCGDGNLDNGEQCDSGVDNGNVCSADYGSSCDYCSLSCETVTVTGGSCGDGIWQSQYEECEGSDGCGPNEECTAECTIVQTPVCGDGVKDAGEQCDNGAANGRECHPTDSESCQYCSATCDLVTLQPDPVFTARQMMRVGIRMQDEDTLVPGDYMEVSVSVSNDADDDAEDVQVCASIPAYGEKQCRNYGDIRDGDTESEMFHLYLPKYAYGYEYLRVSVSNDNYRRVLYREFLI